jgi:hypothetical protein
VLALTAVLSGCDQCHHGKDRGNPNLLNPNLGRYRTGFRERLLDEMKCTAASEKARFPEVVR